MIVFVICYLDFFNTVVKNTIVLFCSLFGNYVDTSTICIIYSKCSSNYSNARDYTQFKKRIFAVTWWKHVPSKYFPKYTGIIAQLSPTIYPPHRGRLVICLWPTFCCFGGNSTYLNLSFIQTNCKAPIGLGKSRFYCLKNCTCKPTLWVVNNVSFN